GSGLIGPLADQLRARRYNSAVIIPSGSLTLLPLHGGRYLVGGGHTYLLDEFDISFSTSASVLNAARYTLERRSANTPLLEAVASPQPGSPPLTYALEELD